MTVRWERDANASRCETALLNGWWEFAPIDNLPSEGALPKTYPERILVPSFWNTLPKHMGGDWEAYRNFDWPERWGEAGTAAYRRVFDLPTRPPHMRARIRFDAVLPGATVFVNGSRVLKIEDGFLPHEADITSVSAWGTSNTLEVLVQPHPLKNGEFLRPAGSWVGWNLRGIWQDCSLRLEPEVRIADVWVRPSVRRHELEVHAAIENASDRERKVSLHHEVVGEAVALDPQPCTVPPGETVTITATVSWPDACLWSPESPRLYWLESRLHLGDLPEADLDARRVRFGFKEFWIEGTGFVLNGTPIRFKGDSWHFMGAVQQTPAYAREWFAMVKTIGANCVRLHAMPHPPFYLDLADEMGVCLIDESAVYGSGGNLALKEEEFWGNARAHVQRLVRRDRNHPSVCLWSACNEIVWRGGEAVFPKLLSLEEAIHDIDPTRPVSFDENNSDLGGGAKIYGGHYGTTAAWAGHWKRNKPLMVNEFSSLYYSGPEEPALWGGEACFADFDARTRAAGEEALETIRGLRALGAASITPWNFVWYGLDPAFPYQPVRLSPDPAAPGIKTQRIGAHSVSLNYWVDSGRRLEPACEEPWRPNAAFDVMRSGYASVAAFLREQNNDFFDEQVLLRHVDVFNDLPTSSVLVMEVTLGRFDRVRRKLDMAAYEHRVVEIPLRIPEVRKAVRAQLTVALSRKQTEGPAVPVQSESIECRVVPRKTLSNRGDRPSRLVKVVDGSGETAAALRAMGYRIQQIDPGAENFPGLLNANGAGTVVVGEGQVTDRTLRAFTSALRDAGFFREGGILVVLGQAFGADAEAPLTAVAREALRAWRRGLPSLWRNLPGDEALRYWSQDGALPWMNGPVATTLYRKPVRGAFVPVAEVADGGEGLEFSPLLWLPVEHGGVFLNGLTSLRNTAKHPVAAALLQGLVEWSAPDERGESPPAPVRVHGGTRSDLRSLTEYVGAEVSEETSFPGIHVVDASSPTDMTSGQPSGLREALRAGATVLVSGVTSDTLGYARELSGVDLRLQTGPWENVAKAKGKEGDRTLEGISQDDLVWVRRGVWEPICQAAFEGVEGLEPLVVTVDTRWAGYAESAEQFKYAMMLRRRKAFEGPGTVVGRVRAGKGQILFTQLEVSQARQFTQKARRLWSLLLANAGVSFREETSPLFERRSPFVDENGYIRRWLVLGPFDGGGDRDKVLSRDFTGMEGRMKPQERHEAAGKTWHLHTATQAAVNLREALAGQPLENAAAYLAVYVDSPRARDLILDTPDMVDLAVGSDDGIRVWLNGDEILTVDTVRPWTADQDCVRGVKLRKGRNLLVLKISQHQADWKASARFLTSAGLPVSDLTYATEPQ